MSEKRSKKVQLSFTEREYHHLLIVAKEENRSLADYCYIATKEKAKEKETEKEIEAKP